MAIFNSKLSVYQRVCQKKYISTIGIHRSDGEYSDFPSSAKDPDEPDDLERCYAFDAGGRGRVGVQQQNTMGIACFDGNVKEHVWIFPWYFDILGDISWDIWWYLDI